MPGTGYPDYERLSRSGGFQLYSSTGPVPEFSTLFEGYVGAWPVVNLFLNSAASADFAQINMLWSPDSTFGSVIGQKFAVRAGSMITFTQYANLSDWLHVYYVSKSGLTFPFNQFSLYAVASPIDRFGLGFFDVPQYANTVSVGAGATSTLQPIKTQPGDAILMGTFAATTWTVTVQYYDYPSNSFIVLTQFGSAEWTQHYFTVEVPMLDAPMQILAHNSDAGAQNFTVAWMAK